tara:strand:- start:20299 stop:20556 length:258 start_codon:yes stop_codon:yes gene_type:complete
MSNKLNFTALTKLNPTIYEEFINSLGQKVQLVEHPINGDESPVIAIFPDLQLAYYTDFFECEEISEVGGEYEVVIIANEFLHGAN